MRNVSAVVLILTMVLVFLGVVYGRWFETLSISGTVDTGEVDWELVTCTVRDTHAPPPYSGPGTIPDWTCGEGFKNPRPGPGDKNVGWGQCRLIDSDEDGDKETVELSLNNVYPCYFNEVEILAENNGTVPIIVDRVIINDQYVLRKSPTPVIRLDLNNDGKNDIELWWGNGFGIQLDPKDWSEIMSFYIHVLKGAPEKASLKFKIEIEAVQWNEYVKL